MTHGRRAIRLKRDSIGKHINVSMTCRRGTVKQRASDPLSGQIWFGTSAKDIRTQLEAEEITIPLYFIRVGSDYYLRKGSHWC